MKLSIEQLQLLRGLQTIEHAVNDRSALPVLANVLVETKEQELVLTATDLEVGVQCRLPLLQSTEHGAVTIPARRLATIVRELPQEPVTLEAKNNHAAILACGMSRFRIPGLPPEDFPILPSFEQTETVSMPQRVLKELISQTMFAMSIEETRFVLNGALLTIDGTNATFVATDGRRLAVAQASATSGNLKIGVVIPAKTIRELARLLREDGEEPVVIAPIKDNQLLFECGAVTVITRLIEGQFPQYAGVIPPPSTQVLTVTRALFASAVRRASLMTSASSQAVVFEIAKDRLVIMKESPEFGSAREELPAEYPGSPVTIAFNPEYWLDVAKALDVETLAIELTSSEKPAVVRLPQLTYVVLPMKLS